MAVLTAEQLALAAERYRKLSLRDAFDPMDLSTRPTETQLQVIKEFGKVPRQYIVAANQCLAKGTLIMTPAGPTPIEEIHVGDWVYSEYGKPIRVLETFQNGPKETYRLTHRNKEWARATAEHVWLAETYDRRDQPKGLSEVPTAKLGKKSKVKRVFVQAPLGEATFEFAYSLGACLGDGCSRQTGRKIQISSGDDKIPSVLALELQGSYYRNHPKNYTWTIDVDYTHLPYYADWCRGLYAHEKIVNMSIVRTWDRLSALRFLAGIFDTEGSLCGNAGARTVRWSVGMQAKSVVDAVEYLVRALWQVDCTRGIDNRDKYVNGPLYLCTVTSAHDIRRMMEELQPHLVSEQKYWKDEYNSYGNRSYADRVSFALEYYGEEETYDIHVDSSSNLYLLANGLVTHNSGKSQTCMRLITWVLTETHPYWSRPERWKQEELKIIVCGRTGKQIEDILGRLENFLEPGSYKVVRLGNIPQKLVHNNGNHIIFQSLENPAVARERIQSYVAHVAWVDEQPPIVGLIDELLMRLQSRGGYFLASFTPLVHSPAIKKLVDSCDGVTAKKYQFKMFDNPLYSNQVKRQEVLAAYAHLSEAARNCRINGDWMEAESSVWHIDRDFMIEAPKDYHPGWRHIEASDPAVSSKFGLSIWAESPTTGTWYMIRDDYIEGIAAPDDIVAEVKQRTSGVNIMRRVCDPHESWYLGQASKAGLVYMCPIKDGRKEELIKGLQHALSNGTIKVAPWCTRFLEEVEGAQWAETDTGKPRIVGASKLHLADTAQYFVDCKPPQLKEELALPWHESLRRSDAAAKEARYNASAKVGNRKKWRVR